MKLKTRTVRSVRRGFTLVEALVVVIIIGSLVAILLVALGGVLRGARTSSERLEIGLTEGWVRMSVGLEDAEDLAEDVLQALDKV